VILVDTSVWVDHLRADDAALLAELRAENVLTHSFVIGELALGHLNPREEILENLGDLPLIEPATNEEVLTFVNRNRLFGLGIGYVDVHLLAAAQLTAGTTIWTRDRRLVDVASRLGIALRLPH
jgi:predicted nucleic acid-binding protein